MLVEASYKFAFENFNPTLLAFLDLSNDRRSTLNQEYKRGSPGKKFRNFFCSTETPLNMTTLGPDHFGHNIRMVIKTEAAITAPKSTP